MESALQINTKDTKIYKIQLNTSLALPVTQHYILFQPLSLILFKIRWMWLLIVEYVGIWFTTQWHMRPCKAEGRDLSEVKKYGA